MSARVHVIGAGLAGLSAALSIAEAGRPVTVHESGPAPGGRCRSYFDRELGLTIDNGNHLLLGGNHAAFAYLGAIGGTAALAGPAEPMFPFHDLNTGARWVVRPSPGRVPWWVFSRRRRVPGTRIGEYLKLLSLRGIEDDSSVAEAVPPGRLYERLVRPLALAALNTKPETGLARLLGAVVRETLMRGGAACLPRFPRAGLSAAFIDPALARLRALGAEVRLKSRVAALEIEGERVVTLHLPDTSLKLGPGESVVLAVPPWVAGDLLPALSVPDAFEAILNVHFRLAADPGPAGFVGLIGGTAEWVFVKEGHVSVTISAANRLAERPADVLAATVWPEVRAALDLPGNLAEMPPWRVVKEKRATFAATAEQERRRPGPRIGLANLALAGDWTATGLPATIEGAIRSGRRAAQLALSS
ncbi:MAG TPA: hydroxysqualene dehydroxylase HpnE [Acetobacteraceae bacterium]|nr:hydroxysqualene dehydroxylase HpnE [Acetobacteraceae bacterium]